MRRSTFGPMAYVPVAGVILGAAGAHLLATPTARVVVRESVTTAPLASFQPTPLRVRRRRHDRPDLLHDRQPRRRAAGRERVELNSRSWRNGARGFIEAGLVPDSGTSPRQRGRFHGPWRPKPALLRGFSESGEGTRTLDLLHGKAHLLSCPRARVGRADRVLDDLAVRSRPVEQLTGRKDRQPRIGEVLVCPGTTPATRA